MVMANSGSGAVHLGPVRALVRYVDEQRAVVDTQVSIERVLPPIDVEADDDVALDVLLEINGEEGFYDEKQAVLTGSQPWATLRMEVVYPERWWPAGMGVSAYGSFAVQRGTGRVVVDDARADVGAPD